MQAKPTPPPRLFSGNQNASTAGLVLDVVGGTAGQKIKADVTVILSIDLGVGPATDTAVWTPSTGPAINAQKSGSNTYTFTGVTIILPGSGAPFEITISNMKINTSKASQLGPSNVIASVTITAAPGDPALVPVPNLDVVATVLPG